MDRGQQAALRLHLTDGLGRARLLKLLQAFGSTEAVLDADPRDWERCAKGTGQLAGRVPPADDPQFGTWMNLLDQAGVRILTCQDSDYPEPLASIVDPPALLYLRGRLPKRPALAVVGARRSSDRGRRWTRELCRELASAGLAIISGLARGIDTAAHLGCLDSQGETVAVLGCGIDQIYPPENRQLAEQILGSGAILTEYPPGSAPLAGHFPGRNRLISALSAGVLVVEAATGSGSLITVEFALEQGREVFAVPGSPGIEISTGTNQLLKDGAHLVTEAADIIEILAPGRIGRRAPDQLDRIPENLGDREKSLYKSLSFEPTHIDELTRKSALTPMEVSDILLHLELAGWIEQLPGTRFLRSRERH